MFFQANMVLQLLKNKNNMKLLIENWKRYLKEQDEGEEYNYDAEVAKEKKSLKKNISGLPQILAK